MKAHILLVEDNAIVLGATRLLLSRENYRVTTATQVAEAVERARDNPDLDLVITDYHLAGGSTGRQVITALREIRGPTFRAIVVTGDTTSVVHAFDGDNYVRWLCKPMSSAQLLAAVRGFLPPHGVSLADTGTDSATLTRG